MLIIDPFLFAYKQMNQELIAPKQGELTVLTEAKEVEEKIVLGVSGRWMWPIRIGSFLLFAATLAVNYLIGLKTGDISDRYHLYVTPPGMFFLIWAFIYTFLGVINVYNLIVNDWTPRVHFWFALSNIFNTAWILVFNIGNDGAIYASSVILLSLVPLILMTWIELGKRNEEDFGRWAYIMRNVFAFYLGWVIAATNLNLGMDIVYWWGAEKKTQLAIFWVMAPCCAIGASAFNYVREGKRGLFSCLALWLSVAWAFSVAGITSHGCLAGTLSLC
jgi:hypothetical protein